MSDARVAQVLGLSNSYLTRACHKLFIILAHHENVRTGLCCPGHALLARELMISQRHVKRLERQLEQDGWIQVIPGQGRGNLTTYRLLLPGVHDTPEEAFKNLAEKMTPQLSQHLAQLPYEKFLRTPYWQTVRRYLIAKYHGCQLCMSDEGLQVHHRSYRYRGSEIHHLEDLIVLCRTCHGGFHEK